MWVTQLWELQRLVDLELKEELKQIVSQRLALTRAGYLHHEDLHPL
jgi:hypothetical protein